MVLAESWPAVRAASSVKRNDHPDAVDRTITIVGDLTKNRRAMVGGHLHADFAQSQMRKVGFCGRRIGLNGHYFGQFAAVEKLEAARTGRVGLAQDAECVVVSGHRTVEIELIIRLQPRA